ncbi:hypothetical protein A1O3_10366 [Capronia epimyces CBS 606.96]|uniref:Uncharacterized protein n=1 Tax=Capronia epimyces CBS 606.96 TaxID=1182542 RepID=W9XAD4_9EURO|nr:uncharacterized protein A1O3_10366 [Capronia epimyces CBS 606.96]EXJ77208.1 hypothetical protein A1O3_10366 [Capronia epimyces CBS 606.96]
MHEELRTLWQFDHIKTPDGFGTIPTPYHAFVFNGFYAFDPSHPLLEGIISLEDLNCAVSQPNALYGTRDNFKSILSGRPASGTGTGTDTDRKPSIQPSNSTHTFTIHRLKLKPLNMPLGSATVYLQGSRRSSKVRDADEVLNWSVDFPAGFHDVLDVRVREFSGKTWDRLEVLYVWADFHYNEVILDWEFCLDDMEVEID